MFALTEFHATLAADNDDGDDGGNEIQLNEEDSSSQAMTVKVIQKYQKLKLQQKKCLKNGNFEAASRNLFDKEIEREIEIDRERERERERRVGDLFIFYA